MNRLQLPLKWRFTLLMILLMTLAGIALTVAINIDIQKNIPMTIDTMVGREDEIIISFDPEAILTLQEQPQDPNRMPISSSEFEIIMTEAVSNVYTTSIITLIVIICLGGISAYFLVSKALMPIRELNEDIKNINENNLLSTLEVKGVKDEIKELTISYNQMLAKLNNAFVSQKRFNASIAHEIKTPLAVIKTNIDVLNEADNKTLEMYQETIDIVKDSVNRLNNMIEAMLDLVRQENAPLDDAVDLNQIIEDILEDLEYIAATKQVRLNYEEQLDIPIIKGNEILIYRAIYNIVENGIKYNVELGEVNISVSVSKDYINVYIQDTGKGMTVEAVKHIFEPFYRIDKFNIDISSGLGLGLCLAQSTVAIHGGEINVESRLNEGTTFTIKLPILKYSK